MRIRVRKIFILLYLLTPALGLAQTQTFNDWVGQGDLNIQKARYREALACFERADALKDTLSVKKKLVMAYELNGLYTKAVDVQKIVVEHHKSDDIQLFKLANLYKKTGELVKAYHVFSKLCSIDDKNPTYTYELALLSPDVEARKALFLKSYRIDSLHLKSIVKLANIYFKSGVRDSAQTFIGKGLVIYPKHIKLRTIKAKLLYREQQYQEAYDLFFELLKTNQENIETNLYLGILSMQLDQLDKAEYYLDRAYRLNPKLPDTNYYLGVLYREFKAYKKSNKYFKASIALKQPDFAKDYYQMGLNAQNLKQPQQALVYFKQAYENNPRYYKALYELAVMTDLLYKDKQMALKYYDEYLSKFKSVNSELSDEVFKRMVEIKRKEFLEGRL